MAQMIFASPSAGKAIRRASRISSGVAPSRSARPRYCRNPLRVWEWTLVMTEIRLRVFGSRWRPASLRKAR